MRLLLLSLIAMQLSGASAAAAQSHAAGTPADSGSVTGTVYDSLAGTPLVEAVVQLVAAADAASFSRTATTDSLGRYTIAGIPSGRYLIGFLHPMLDSLGIDAPIRQVALDRGTLRVDLAVPSPQSLSAAVCTAAAPGDSTAAVVGVIRDAVRRTPVADAVVAAEWLELSIAATGLQRSVARREARTAASGWFALCDVPRGGTMQMSASRDVDSTDAVEVEVPTAGFLRRDLSLGAGRELAAPTIRAGQDTLPFIRRRSGEGKLSGVVLEAVGGRPLSGAQVSIAGVAGTLSDARGEWTLSDVPMGTRSLEVRAIGFYPERQAVEVVEDARSVRTALRTMQAVLDTVRIVASRTRLQRTGFDDRRRSGMGRYITAEDIARRLTLATSDIFRTVPGLWLDRQPLGDTQLTARGPFGRCTPAVYIDGMMMRGLSADDIDAFVHPDDVAGVEVYTGTMVPPEFQAGLTGCGSLVIWTSPALNRAAPGTWKERVTRAAGAILLGVGIGTLFSRR